MPAIEAKKNTMPLPAMNDTSHHEETVWALESFIVELNCIRNGARLGQVLRNPCGYCKPLHIHRTVAKASRTPWNRTRNTKQIS